MNDDSLQLASGVLLLGGTASAGSLAAVNKETGLEKGHPNRFRSQELS